MAKLLQIDEQSRPDHPYLNQEDDCFYVLEYTPREGPFFSSTNQLILNLKKTVDRKGKPEYRHKERAIIEAGNLFRSVLRCPMVANCLWTAWRSLLRSTPTDETNIFIARLKLDWNQPRMMATHHNTAYGTSHRLT